MNYTLQDSVFSSMIAIQDAFALKTQDDLLRPAIRQNPEFCSSFKPLPQQQFRIDSILSANYPSSAFLQSPSQIGPKYPIVFNHLINSSLSAIKKPRGIIYPDNKSPFSLTKLAPTTSSNSNQEALTSSYLQETKITNYSSSYNTKDSINVLKNEEAAIPELSTQITMQQANNQKNGSFLGSFCRKPDREKPHGVRSASKKIKRTQIRCGHTERKHYAKGLCNLCYFKYRRLGLINTGARQRLSLSIYRPITYNCYFY